MDEEDRDRLGDPFVMTQPEPAAIANYGLSTRQKLLLALILTGQFMAVLDASIVNVAIPTIRRDLGASGAELQLIVAGYVIAYAVLLITGARLGCGSASGRTFLWGLALFTVASLACGVAPTSQVLIVVRAIQGAGAALMVPQVFSLIQRNFTGPAGPRRSACGPRPWRSAVWSVRCSAAFSSAPTSSGTGWRPVFLVNVPIGIVLLIASFGCCPSTGPSRPAAGPRRAPLAGRGRPAAGRAAGPWPRGGLAGVDVRLAGRERRGDRPFALIERSVERRGGAPLIAERVLRAPGLPSRR